MITSLLKVSANDFTGASERTTQKKTLELALPIMVSFDGSCGTGWCRYQD